MMKKSTKINIGLTGLAIIISAISLIYSSCQDKKIRKIQYELNAINYKPIVKIESIEFKSFQEKIDSAVLVGELNDSTGLINVYTKILTDVSFKLKNVGNTNARIRGALCIDTISGSDKLRDIFFNERIELFPDSLKTDFYDYQQIQPNEVDDIKFKTEIRFIKNENFAIHLLLFYENDLNNLYDTYYWAKFQKKNIEYDMKVDTTNHKILNAKMSFGKDQILKFIDDNTAYKTYSKKEKERFEEIMDKLKNNAH
jgi:hypothetical protein